MRWEQAVSNRLRAAMHNPPSAQDVRPIVDSTVRQVATRAAGAGMTARVGVVADQSRIVVRAEGPGAGRILASVRRGLADRRGEMVEQLHRTAAQRLRG